MSDLVARLRSGEDGLEYAAADELDALRAENARLRGALADMYAGWRYIRLHYGDLSGVGWERCDASARAALDLDGQKERRAKALSELAEMDADLLDIDPEVKP
jgi:hypothetical protein